MELLPIIVAPLIIIFVICCLYYIYIDFRKTDYCTINRIIKDILKNDTFDHTEQPANQWYFTHYILEIEYVVRHNSYHIDIYDRMNGALKIACARNTRLTESNRIALHEISNVLIGEKRLIDVERSIKQNWNKEIKT